VGVYRYLEEQQKKGIVPNGLLYLDTGHADMHALAGTVPKPMTQLPFEQLCPGSAALEKLQEDFE
jgi:2-oxoglutarate ferredoxin oxidoreductase subunit beta